MSLCSHNNLKLWGYMMIKLGRVFLIEISNLWILSWPVCQQFLHHNLQHTGPQKCPPNKLNSTELTRRRTRAIMCLNHHHQRVTATNSCNHTTGKIMTQHSTVGKTSVICTMSAHSVRADRGGGGENRAMEFSHVDAQSSEILSPSYESSYSYMGNVADKWVSTIQCSYCMLSGVTIYTWCAFPVQVRRVC